MEHQYVRELVLKYGRRRRFPSSGPLSTPADAAAFARLLFHDDRETFVGLYLDAHTHNHPSGDTTPSADDVECYKRLLKAGHMLGIEVLDCLVVTEKDCVSLKVPR